MPRLTIYRDDRQHSTIELAERDLRIGRGAQNDIVLEDSTKAISRFHAELRYQDGKYSILDLNSQNGTWMNGESITQADLSPGSTVTIGEYRLTLDEKLAAGGDSGLPDTLVGGGTVLVPPSGQPSAPAGVRAEATPVAAESSGLRADAAAVRSHRSRKMKAASVDPAPKPGLINWLARQPKPIVFGAFALFLIVMMGVRVILSGDPTPAPVATSTPAPTVATPPPPPPPPTNEERIAAHITVGKDKLAQGDLDAARQEFDAALLIDSRHPEAEELKTKVEDLIANAKRAPEATPATAGGTPPTAPPPATGAAPAAGTQLPSASVAAPRRGAAATAKPGEAASTRTTNGRTPVPLPPEQGGLTPMAGERAASLKARIAGMQVRYDNGKAAIQNQDYRTAISIFSDIVKEEPRYRDAAGLIDQARAGLRDSARQTVATAQKQAADGQLLEALQSFERARRLDPQVDGVEEGVKQVRDRMRRTGEDAYKRAKQYDAVGRVPEAIALYEQAVKMLPEGDANRKLAQDRLAALKP